MNIINGFHDNDSSNEITYVVAVYSSYKKKWFHRYEGSELEIAKEKMEEYQKLHPRAKVGIFEHIKSETINEICL